MIGPFYCHMTLTIATFPSTTSKFHYAGVIIGLSPSTTPKFPPLDNDNQINVVNYLDSFNKTIMTILVGGHP